MNLQTFKIIAIIAVATVGMMGGLLSLKLSDSKNSKRWFSLGNAFAAGVFLAAGLIHMLPDANEEFSKLSDFPWAFLVCAIGFFLILFLERVVMHSHDAISDVAAHKPPFQVYILTVILSVHSIIAGVALGTEERFNHSLVILFAILAHKGSAAFALSINLLKQNVSRAKLLKILAIFCSMTPLGIVGGILIASHLQGTPQQLLTASFDALAAGTFLYVSILGIAHEEFSNQTDKVWKFILMGAGIGVMAVVAIWT